MVPESVIWILSARCNLNCKHCYTSRFSKKIFEKELYIKVLEDMLSFDVNSVGFTGGEPLLFPYIKDLLERVKNVPRVTIATNGILINEAWAELFSTMGNLHIYVSIDGLEDSHDFLRGSGTYRKVVEAMRLLERYGASRHVMMAIGSFNYREAPEVFKVAADLGAGSFSMIPIMPSGKAVGSGLVPEGRQVLEAVEMVAKVMGSYTTKVDVWCASFVREFLDCEDVTVASCRLLSNVDISPSFDLLLCDVIDVKAANILEEGSFSKALEKFSEMDPGPVSNDVCTSCGNYNFCMGGCFARAYMEDGRIDAPDPLCPKVKGVCHGPSSH